MVRAMLQLTDGPLPRRAFEGRALAHAQGNFSSRSKSLILSDMNDTHRRRDRLRSSEVIFSNQRCSSRRLLHRMAAGSSCACLFNRLCSGRPNQITSRTLLSLHANWQSGHVALQSRVQRRYGVTLSATGAHTRRLG